MIKIFENPEYMEIDDIKEKFYPNSVVLINCKVKYYAPVSGYVAAAETKGSEDFIELQNYEIALRKETKNGKVFLIDTQYPYEDEALFIDFIE